jgi:hypothetical protein
MNHGTEEMRGESFNMAKDWKTIRVLDVHQLGPWLKVFQGTSTCEKSVLLIFVDYEDQVL